MANVLVTGANRGIGLEMCRLYAERGDSVVAVCRQPSDALRELGVRIETGVDQTDQASVDKLAGDLGNLSIDVLINNAGILRVERLDGLDFESMLRQYEVNALGPLRVTAALLPSLGSGSKVAIVTSRMGSIGDNTSGGYYGYRMSKAAVNMAGMSLARDLRGREIAVAILHPGFVRTDMTRGLGDIEPRESARGLIARIDELTLARTGGFWHTNGEVLMW